MPQAPEMLTGMRAPQSVRLEDIRKNAANADALPTPFAAPAGVNVYVSLYRSYLIEVVNIPAYVDQGRRVPSKRIAAQFSEGVFRNDHRDLATRKLIDDALQANPYFGKFGSGPKTHFWLASEQQAALESARIADALRTLKSLPKEMVAQYAADLVQGSADDHTLPDADAAADARGTARAESVVRPIPAVSKGASA